LADRISLATLNDATLDDFAAALDGIFEHAPWVAAAAFEARPFATVTALHDAMMQAVLIRAHAEQIAFIRLHPDLAGRAARAGTIAPASVAEQAGLGLDQLSDEEYLRFERLNTAYGERFGFPFVVCVRRLTRAAILDAFERRLGQEPESELKTALAEIGYITRLRLAEQIEGPGAPTVTGQLTTHVLDIHGGGPAADVLVELYEIGPAARSRLTEVVTNADGRTDEPLLFGAPLRMGTYELIFHVGAYFARRGLDLPPQPFLEHVPLRFGISEPEGHYHVPLVLTPWSYSTYRGS
jgi:2-oxo-4-hydroxy-4-carboxy-5-ureidoimidazoline decarboxylase